MGRATAAGSGVTIAEAARRLGVSTKTIRRRIASGEIAAHRTSGPGGFAYRVTDPRVLVIPAGQASPPTPAGRDGQAGARAWTSLVTSLTERLAAAEVRAARAEWERDQLRAALAGARDGPPAPPALGAPRRPWWRRWLGG